MNIYLGTQGRGAWRVNLKKPTIVAVEGKVSFLRFHALGSGYGAPPDQTRRRGGRAARHCPGTRARECRARGVPRDAGQEIDLPLLFTVVYQDLERDAEIGPRYAKRVAGPSSAMHSQNEATFDLPLMLTAAAKSVNRR